KARLEDVRSLARDREQKAAASGPNRAHIIDQNRKSLQTEEETLAEIMKTRREQILDSLHKSDRRQRERARQESQLTIANMSISLDTLRGRVQEMLEKQVKSSGDAVELEFAKSELAQADGVYQKISDRLL